MLTEYTPSLAELEHAITEKETLQEKQHYGERTLQKPKGLFKASLALAPILLKSALFRPAAGDRATHNAEVEIPTEGGHKVYFKGEELRQDDQRVLLLLLKQRFDCVVTDVIEIQPHVFVREVLKWSDSGVNVKKLKDCIKRLQAATVRIAHKDGSESVYSFVTDYDFENDDKKIRVWLSARLVSIFERGATFLPEAQRLSIGDNLVSWCFGYVKAQVVNKVVVETAKMRELAAMESYKQNAFNRSLKAALGELKAAGVVEHFEIKGALLTIEIARK